MINTSIIKCWPQKDMQHTLPWSWEAHSYGQRILQQSLHTSLPWRKKNFQITEAVNDSKSQLFEKIITNSPWAETKLSGVGEGELDDARSIVEKQRTALGVAVGCWHQNALRGGRVIVVSNQKTLWELKWRKIQTCNQARWNRMPPSVKLFWDATSRASFSCEITSFNAARL